MPFSCPRPRAENFKDQAGPIDHLAGPGALQIALLDRRQSTADNDEPDLVGLDPIMDLLDHAATEQGRGSRSVERHGPHADDIQRNRMRETGRLIEKRVRAPPTIGVGVAANDRLKHQRSRWRRAGFIRHRVLVCAQDERLLNRLDVGIDVSISISIDVRLVRFGLEELDRH